MGRPGCTQGRRPCQHRSDDLLARLRGISASWSRNYWRRPRLGWTSWAVSAWRMLPASRAVGDACRFSLVAGSPCWCQQAAAILGEGNFSLSVCSFMPCQASTAEPRSRSAPINLSSFLGAAGLTQGGERLEEQNSRDLHVGAEGQRGAGWAPAAIATRGWQVSSQFMHGSNPSQTRSP